MGTPRLLLVHAHPDDESLWTGGLIARHTDAGGEVDLVMCTWTDGTVRHRELADAVDIEITHPLPGKYVEELWEHHVKGDLVRPTFVMDFPVDTSPLVREHRSRPGMVEKWDLYVRGFELATAYSELVDPVVQRERFVEQAKLAAGGDLEAMRLDEAFLTALEHGMPPAGGIGIGIDRLCIMLLGQESIRDVILFPQLKPRDDLPTPSSQSADPG